MGARLFVGNLSHKTTEGQLERFFSSWGSVASVRIPLDRQTGHSRGFGFVELASEELAELALAVFNGRELGGRVLRLSRAVEPTNGSGPPGVRSLVPDRATPHARIAAAGALDEPWETAADAFGDYSRDHGREHGSRRHKHGKHGSDRKRAQGTRRVIE